MPEPILPPAHDPLGNHWKPPKESKLDKASRFLAALSVLIFLFSLPGLRSVIQLILAPIQAIFCLFASI